MRQVTNLLIVVVVIVLVLLAVGVGTNEIPGILPTKTVTIGQSSTTGSLYVVNVGFSGSNVSVSIGNSGGGVPTPNGYGDTGVTARFIGAIIIQSGAVYYHYNWNCQLSTPCALAPGPLRYFTLTSKTTSLASSWNLGNSSLVPDILSVGGSLSAGMIFPWSNGGHYVVYLESNDNSIIANKTASAP